MEILRARIEAKGEPAAEVSSRRVRSASGAGVLILLR
jgi:hypothetical protein